MAIKQSLSTSTFMQRSSQYNQLLNRHIFLQRHELDGCEQHCMRSSCAVQIINYFVDLVQTMSEIRNTASVLSTWDNREKPTISEYPMHPGDITWQTEMDKCLWGTCAVYHHVYILPPFVGPLDQGWTSHMTGRKLQLSVGTSAFRR